LLAGPNINFKKIFFFIHFPMLQLPRSLLSWHYVLIKRSFPHPKKRIRSLRFVALRCVALRMLLLVLWRCFERVICSVKHLYNARVCTLCGHARLLVILTMSSSGQSTPPSTTGPYGAVPASVIQDDKVHTLHYSQVLPYASQLDREAELWLSDICTQLVVSVQSHDFAPGCLFWVKSLSR
jgi:hypothetical protein